MQIPAYPHFLPTVRIFLNQATTGRFPSMMMLSMHSHMCKETIWKSISTSRGEFFPTSSFPPPTTIDDPPLIPSLSVPQAPYMAATTSEISQQYVAAASEVEISVLKVQKCRLPGVATIWARAG